jgi:hypothetical protein
VAEVGPPIEVPPFKDAVFEGGELKHIQGIPVLFVQGEPEQMGRQYARLLIDTVRPAAALPKRILGVGANGVWTGLLAESRAALDRVPQRYRREIDAIIEAGGLSEAESEAVLAANGLIEVYGTGPSAALLVEPQRSATGQMLFGRELHTITYGCLDRLSLVTVRRPAGRHAFASVGFAGALSVMAGMNDAGLALATLDSGPAKDGSMRVNPSGAPLHLVTYRILEECSTVEEAEALLTSVEHMALRNLAVCDARRAVVFEITPKNVVARGAEDDLLAATNHFRTPELSVGEECEHYDTLRKVWQKKDPLTWVDVAEALREAGGDGLHTMIFEPATLKLRVAIGKTDSAKSLVTLDLSELFQHAPDASDR